MMTSEGRQIAVTGGSEGSEEKSPIIAGLLAKRAQGRSTFGRTNWKRRWFELYPTELSYWTLQGGKSNAASECKGRVAIDSIHALERVNLNTFGKPYMLQIVHRAVLYIQCTSRGECDQWLLELRKLCARNKMHTKYHPGCFDGSRWSCCLVSHKEDKGCEAAFNYHAFAKDSVSTSTPTLINSISTKASTKAKAKTEIKSKVKIKLPYCAKEALNFNYRVGDATVAVNQRKRWYKNGSVDNCRGVGVHTTFGL